MALNIPMPMDPNEALNRGINSGSQLFERIMRPRLEREKQAQLEKHFQEEMDFRKKQFARSGANSDLQRKMLELGLKKAEREADPQKMFEYVQQIKKLSQGMNGGAPQETGNPQGQYPALDKMFSGQGMFPADEQEASPMQQQAQQMEQGNNQQEPPQQTGGMFGNLSPDEQMMMQMAGIKIPTIHENPEHKRWAELQNKIAFEKYKAGQEAKLPGAIRTLHENIIHLSPRASKAIQHLIDIPSPFEPYGLGGIQSGQKAAHKKAVTAAAETYAKAKGWPNTKGSIEKAESILERGHLESDSDYRKRLREYQDELAEGAQSSNQFLHANQQGQEPPSNVIEYVRLNGKLVPKGGR